ncbi:hypothetical protein [Nocardia brasiliensis]|uniref:hypothetical protein n=1 Tax=Nocardia brasiliensis TaxID=37326 RepID=UPI00245611EE|nr:hypothetical protein [Nocardia brasiliensis]
MANNFQLRPRTDLPDPSVWNRTWRSWKYGQSDQRTCTQNRGDWNLNRQKAARERFATAK